MAKKVFLFTGDKTRLDKYLVDQLGREFSRVQIQTMIAKGKVEVNGRLVSGKSAQLKIGDKISIDILKPKLRPRPEIGLQIVYEDNEILVIEKPAGLVVHPAPSQDKPSLAAGLIARYKTLKGLGDEFRPGIVHRLDEGTSGLLLVAKTRSAYKFLLEAFRLRQVEKEYLALVHGKLLKSHGILEAAIGRKAGQKKFSSGFGREAKTEYWVVGYYSDGVDIYTLIRVRLHTGRTHQIRVHFSSLGYPVAGDKLYGGKFRKGDQKLFPRQFLHAARLKLQLPGGSTKEFVSSLPADLVRILNILTPLV